MTRENKLKKVFCSLFVCIAALFCVPAFSVGTFACGEGYIKVSSAKIDGLVTEKCEKLWCKDLETDSLKSMGNGNTPANGYRSTSEPITLSDSDGTHTIKCFGDRKWCSGETPGVWNPKYGAYTKNGEDTNTYKSYQKGACFVWRLEKPDCPAGMTAFLQDGEWECRSSSGTTTRSSTIRRTGAVRRK